MKSCVGKFAVPHEAETLVTDDGSFVNVNLVNLSRTIGGSRDYELYKWLWEPLGVPKQAWQKAPLEVAPDCRDPGRSL